MNIPRLNGIIKVLEQDKNVFVSFSPPEPAAAQAIATERYDGVVFEMEHQPYDAGTLRDCLQYLLNRRQIVDAVVSVWRMISAPPGLTPAQAAFWREALKKTTEAAEWKRDLEINYQSDEFMAGAELDRALDALHVQLRSLLTELDLAKKQ